MAHEIDWMQLISCVDWMRDKRTLLWLQRKRRSPQVQMSAMFVVLISKFQSMIYVERNKYILTENLFLRPLKGLELTKSAWQIFKKYTFCCWIHRMENLPVNEEQPLFAIALTPILKAKRRQTIKIKTFSRKFFGLSREVINVSFYHSSCQRSAVLWWTLLSLRPIGCCRCCTEQLTP